MALPTFLGIGAPRSGSTWLHELLASHPDVFVPTRRKEIRFFDRNYDRGLQWYEKFFPADAEAARYRAIGEISPPYLYCPDCPERIAGISSITQLILIMRNPVDRAYSDYGRRLRMENVKLSFEDFLSSRPREIRFGLYSQWLKNYLRYFEKEQFLVLIYEQVMAEVPRTKAAIAHFLELDADRFPSTAGAQRVNRGYLPKSQSIAALVFSVAHHLRRWDMDKVVNWAKRHGIQRVYGDSGSLPPMKEETRKYLNEIYKDDITELEALIELDLACWQQLATAISAAS